MNPILKYLAPPPRFERWPWILGFVFVISAAWLGVTAYRVMLEADNQRTLVEKARKRVQAKPLPKPSPAAIEEQKRWANLNAERAFSWYPLFVAVEQANNPDVELLEFQPEKASRRLTVRGEARNMAAITAYMGQLSAQPAIGNVYLVHQKNVSRNRLSTISFEIRATLKN